MDNKKYTSELQQEIAIQKRAFEYFPVNHVMRDIISDLLSQLESELKLLES
jgi:hypothetical protein